MMSLEKNGFDVAPSIDKRSLIVSRRAPRGVLFTEILKLLEKEDLVDVVDSIEPYHIAGWKIKLT